MRYGDKRPRIIRDIIYILLIIIAAVLQNTDGMFFEPFGARAFLIIPLVAVIAMFEREVSAALFGVLAGAILDISSGHDGFNALVLMILCAVCSLLISHFMQNNIVTALALGAAFIALYEAFYVVVFIVLSGGGNPFSKIFGFYLPSFLFTLLFVPIFYYIVRAVYSSHKTAED